MIDNLIAREEHEGPIPSWRAGEVGDSTEIKRSTWSVEIKRGQPPLVQHGTEEVRAVRVIDDGRLGYASSRTQPWTQLKNEAYAAAKTGPDTCLDEPLLEEKTGYSSSKWDPSWMSSMMGTARELYDRLEQLDSRFRPAVSISYEETQTHLSNSLGGHVGFTRGYWSISAGGRLVSDTDFHAVTETRLGPDALSKISELGDVVEQRFRLGQPIVPVQPGKYPVVFLPTVVMSLLTPILTRLSGPTLLAGSSPWDDKIGQSVLSPLLTLTSDPTISGAPRTGPWDDEGTSTRAISLIEQGILKHFILDRDSARRIGQEPQGMGYRRNPGVPPASLPANLIVSGGAGNLTEWGNRFPMLLVLNGWIGARPTNPIRGDIAGNASELYVMEHGVITGRAKNVVVSLNALDALTHQLLAVGDDNQWVPQGMMTVAPGFLPPLLIDGADIQVRQ
ncbi:TldD/PmbA family protein [Sulfobacillus thermosulfidooxidans]|uniref:TldD/PmbA family protein n=1 Tax=Sulfobacillus thermosulfidooxidans TaxID=28034 RepID=UPI0006B6750A|nr:TldD/PmbA family protein [Sulfobacillus thermosulfidooxidans]